MNAKLFFACLALMGAPVYGLEQQTKMPLQAVIPFTAADTLRGYFGVNDTRVVLSAPKFSEPQRSDPQWESRKVLITSRYVPMSGISSIAIVSYLQYFGIQQGVLGGSDQSKSFMPWYVRYAYEWRFEKSVPRLLTRQLPANTVNLEAKTVRASAPQYKIQDPNKDALSYVLAVEPGDVDVAQKSWFKLWIDNVYVGETEIVFGAKPLQILNYEIR
jgi:hypothetical protein